MPQVSPNPNSQIHRWFKDIFRRLHALEATVPIAKDSTPFITTEFDTASTSYVADSLTHVGPIKCFGNPDNGTNVQVTGFALVGLDSLWSVGGGGVLVLPTGNPIGATIGVQVDGGTTVEPGSGPGIYGLSIAQASLGGILIPATGSRVIQVLSPGATQGLSEHSFRMMFASNFGQTIHFDAMTLAVDPA